MDHSTSLPEARAGAPEALDRRREHRFFGAMVLAIAATVFAGFAPTYYLRPLFHPEPLPLLLRLHGAVFSSWIVLLLVQATLVRARRTDLHRRLGVWGAGLAALMVVLGTTTAILRAKGGFGPPHGPPPRVFLVVPLADMLVFGSLAATAFAMRRRPDVHKRLILLATIGLLAAPIARLPLSVIRHDGLPAVFALADLFLIPCLAYDLATRGRVHAATAWGALGIVVSQPLRLMLGPTAAWLSFATWLTG